MSSLKLFGLSWFLAQAVSDSPLSNPFLQRSDDISQKTAAAFDQLWQVIILQKTSSDVVVPAGGGLYAILSALGLSLAVGTLLIFMMRWTRQMLEGDLQKPLSDLIWPVLVILLLTHQGYLLAQTTVAFRNLLNYVNHSALTVLDQSLQIESRLGGVMNYRILRDEMAAIVSQCDRLMANQDELQTCQTEALKEITALEAAYKQNPIQYLKERGLNEAAALKEKLRSERERYVAPIPRNKAMNQVSASLLELGTAFQQTLESCLLMTALIGPLAVGASLLPLGNKPIAAWFSALLSLELAKLSYNLLNAVVIVTTYYTGVTGNFLHQDFALGAINPLLAFGLSAGGGKALFDRLLQAQPHIQRTIYGKH